MLKVKWMFISLYNIMDDRVYVEVRFEKLDENFGIFLLPLYRKSENFSQYSGTDNILYCSIFFSIWLPVLPPKFIPLLASIFSIIFQYLPSKSLNS